MYVTDALYCIAENTAMRVGGKAPTQQWKDVINPKSDDSRTGDEVAMEVIKKLGLRV